MINNNYLKKIMSAFNLDVNDVAKLAGVDKAAVDAWLSGSAQINDNILGVILDKVFKYMIAKTCAVGNIGRAATKDMLSIDDDALDALLSEFGFYVTSESVPTTKPRGHRF